MAPFAGDRIGAAKDPSAYGDAAADAGAENDAEHALKACRGAVDGLRQREAIGVIGEADRSTKRRFEIALQRAADQGVPRRFSLDRGLPPIIAARPGFA